MAKISWKPGNFVYPLPVVMASCGNTIETANIITVAWTGTICTNPPMVYISIRPERHSFEIIKNTGEFVINLTTENLVFQTDFCGVKSGRDLNKFNHLHLTPVKCSMINSYYISESPVNIECVVNDIIPLGSHSMITALVVNILVEDKFIDAKGKFHFNSTKPIVYSHGEYRGLFKKIGKFGFSVEKKKKK